MEVRVRSSEACEAERLLFPDLVWDSDEGYADLDFAGPFDPGNANGLKADRALATAIVMALFTDRAVETYEIENSPSPDLRGWWGDGLDVDSTLYEQPLGSKLWLLERSTLNEQTFRTAERYALEALQPLVQQGLCERFEVVASGNITRGILFLEVRAFSGPSNKLYDQKFRLVWRQEAATFARGN